MNETDDSVGESSKQLARQVPPGPYAMLHRLYGGTGSCAVGLAHTQTPPGTDTSNQLKNTWSPSSASMNFQIPGLVGILSPQTIPAQPSLQTISDKELAEKMMEGFDRHTAETFRFNRFVGEMQVNYNLPYHRSKSCFIDAFHTRLHDPAVPIEKKVEMLKTYRTKVPTRIQLALSSAGEPSYDARGHLRNFERRKPDKFFSDLSTPLMQFALQSRERHLFPNINAGQYINDLHKLMRNYEDLNFSKEELEHFKRNISDKNDSLVLTELPGFIVYHQVASIIKAIYHPLEPHSTKQDIKRRREMQSFLTKFAEIIRRLFRYAPSIRDCVNKIKQSTLGEEKFKNLDLNLIRNAFKDVLVKNGILDVYGAVSQPSSTRHNLPPAGPPFLGFPPADQKLTPYLAVGHFPNYPGLSIQSVASPLLSVKTPDTKIDIGALQQRPPYINLRNVKVERSSFPNLFVRIMKSSSASGLDSVSNGLLQNSTCHCQNGFLDMLGPESLAQPIQRSTEYVIRTNSRLRFPSMTRYNLVFRLVNALETAKSEIEFADGALDRIKRNMEEKFNSLNETKLEHDVYFQYTESVVKKALNVQSYCQNTACRSGIAKRGDVNQFASKLLTLLTIDSCFPLYNGSPGDSILMFNQLHDSEEINVAVAIARIQSILEELGVY